MTDTNTETTCPICHGQFEPRKGWFITGPEKAMSFERLRLQPVCSILCLVQLSARKLYSASYDLGVYRGQSERPTHEEKRRWFR